MTVDEKNLGSAIARRIWPHPSKAIRCGRYVDLDPLSPEHVNTLWKRAAKAPESFTYLRYGPFATDSELLELVEDLSTRPDQPFWAVIPKEEEAQGWLSICDIYPKDGSIEIGSVWFSPDLQGTRAARESIFLLMSYVMDELGYERLVWRCQAQNTKSFKAALNLGFTYEGTWRRAAIVDGWQRDVAWFSILKDEWSQVRNAFTEWLAPENFDAFGRQKRRLDISR